MKFLFIFCGGKYDAEIAPLAESFCARVARYVSVDTLILAERAKKKGADPLMHVRPTDEVIVFDERGNMYSSEDFALLLTRANVDGKKRVVVIVGDAFGVDEAVRKRADHLIAFSKMIFPHQLARVIALEQTYRALSINAGSKYHHGE